MNIVFMGTPDFAAASLAALLEMSEHSVSGVFTQPDRAAGRGMKTVFCAVKELALRAGVPVYQPVKMRDGSAAELLRSLKPDLCVAAAYGRILTRELLDIPSLGCINVHASLLPELRGAAPIQWAIARGHTETGVTIQRLAEECDAGDILIQKSTPIGEDEDSGSLYARLRDMGAALLAEAVHAIESITPVPQDHSKATFAPILRKEDGIINLSHSLREISCLIRGMNPWPGAFLGEIKVHRARPAEKTASAGGRFIQCGDGGILELLEVQAPGKKRMDAEEFFRGYRVKTAEQ